MSLAAIDHQMIAVAKERRQVIVKHGTRQRLATLISWAPKGRDRGGTARVQFNTGSCVRVKHEAIEPVDYCRCGHAQQIHGAALLSADGPRGEGPCSANCLCDNYVEAKKR